MKLERAGIHAKTKAGRRGAILEHMAQVRVTADAKRFDPVHIVAPVVLAGHGAIG